MKYRKKSKYEQDTVIVRTKICKIDFLNQLINNRYKSVFYCPSNLEPNGRMCIYWGRTSEIKTGDEIEMKGRFIDGAFLVWSFKRKCGGI